MNVLLDGLLQVSRLGWVEISKKELDMNVLMTGVLKEFEFQRQKQNVTIEVADLPPCSGDPGQINQLFANLIGNALKYADPGRPGMIKVSGQKEGAQTLYCVADNGIGIDPDSMQRIFEIFHQLDPKVGGEGLGLNIVSKIAERHDGRVWVESEPGKGSRFYVAL
jgi:signal transduction histidine kinase